MAMKRIVSLVLCALCLLTALSACGTDTENAVPDGLQAMDCKGLPYKAYMPANWDAHRVGDHLESVVSATTPVSLSIHHFACDAVSVEAYWEESAATLATLYDGFAIVEQPDAYTFGTEEGLAVSYEGALGDVAYRFFQAMTLDGGTLYLLTFTAQKNVSTGTDLYKTHIDSAYLVAKNFTLRNRSDNATQGSEGAETDARTEQNTEQGEDMPTDDTLVRIGRNTDHGELYRAYAPSSWIDESYGSFAFARRADGGASFSVSAPIASHDSYADFWRSMETELSALYECTFQHYYHSDEENGIAPNDVQYEVVTLDGVRAERVEYRLKTEKDTYACVCVASYRNGYMYTLTYMCRVQEGETATAELAAMLDAFRFED